MTTTRTDPIARRVGTFVALAALIVSLTATWLASDASAAPPKPAPAPAAVKAAPDDDPPPAVAKKQPKGKLNLNTASEDQLQLRPGQGRAHRRLAQEERRVQARRRSAQGEGVRLQDAQEARAVARHQGRDDAGRALIPFGVWAARRRLRPGEADSRWWVATWRPTAWIA